MTDAFEPSTPMQEHALVAARAVLAEAAGDIAEASALYAEAAERWEAFGNVPELAYALLGHGRCLVALARPSPEVPLARARELFTSMGFKPALAETDGAARRVGRASLLGASTRKRCRSRARTVTSAPSNVSIRPAYSPRSAEANLPEQREPGRGRPR